MNLFNFSLTPAAQCYYPRNGFQPGIQVPHTENERNIAWIWLAEGHFFMDLDKVQLFKYSDKWRKKYNCDSLYAKDKNLDFLYGIFDALPMGSVPIPEEIFHFIETIEAQNILRKKICSLHPEENSEEEALYDKVEQYILRDRSLRHSGCTYWFYRVGETLIIRYDFTWDTDKEGCAKWAATKGEYRMPYRDFITECENFVYRFFTAMQEQVEIAIQLDMNIIAYDRQIKEDQSKGIYKPLEEYLREETLKRKNHFEKVLNYVKTNGYEGPVDWERIKKELMFLSGLPD